ncbi:DUF2313 domain-containing protein [Sporosarcina sp. ANT_H38]|uniref:putative phage tail protein n=1 Tax=Sporosarcina sp. ANT_H38 TaxID=2597358 RepID=UPI0011F2BE60|nr:putative phage tail protein [Sporosarcina sp. ANT_H38]KAA0944064.1 DUF2313 domain-containing protein [Sporosarcina sp. ANT_H38]
MNRVMEELPAYYRDIMEFQELTKVQSRQLNLIDEAIQQFEDDQYILTSSEPAIYRRENEFNILPDRKTETLDFRKRRLLARKQENSPYTFEYLKQLLDSLIGEKRHILDLDVLLLELEVLVNVESSLFYNEVKKMLERIIPLNIDISTAILLASEYLVFYSRVYHFDVPYKICNTFHTAEIEGGIARIPITIQDKTYAFDVLYPICNTFVTAAIAVENEEINVTLASEYRNNDILYKRAGTIYAGEGDI